MTALPVTIVACLVLAAPFVATAGAYPPTSAAMPLPELVVRDEGGLERSLDAILEAAPGPVFLVPGYVTCHGACPLLAKSLKGALETVARSRSGALPHRVAFLSFVGDAPEALRTFREREKLPSSWQLFATRSVAEGKRFLDRYGYLVEKRGGEWLHPNQIFVLTREGRWAASLFVRDGLDAGAVERALAMTGDRSVSTWGQRARSFVGDPRTLLWVGVVGFMIGIMGAIFGLWLAWRRRRSTVPS
jgi:cytochrome oxidase Cu insertion factor (SCO1/SenC/PrrC family)